MSKTEHNHEQLFSDIKDIITRSRVRVFQVANSVLLESYWQIGKLIVEHEQDGHKRAAYGKSVLKELAKSLTGEFGPGFDETNLRKMRQFYTIFPIRDALRLELSWAHYRILMRITLQAFKAWRVMRARGREFLRIKKDAIRLQTFAPG